ncbi:iron chelate uptake ABC transporter family permease subunit [Escherichia coli]
MLAIVASLAFGRDAQGWHRASGTLLDQLMPWRWPRILAALFAGVMLAVAGCIIQRLTGYSMASPEVLGISSGAAFGVVLMLFLCREMPLAGCCPPVASARLRRCWSF